MTIPIDILYSIPAFFLWLFSPFKLLLLIKHTVHPLTRALKPYAPPPSAQGILIHFVHSFQLATFPTIRTLHVSALHALRPLLANPLLPFASPHAFFGLISSLYRLFTPKNIKRVFMAHVWKTFGPGLDEGTRAIKQALIKDARGVVLDIGAGHGHTIPYLVKSQVTVYVALEPNVLMHPALCAMAAKHGYTKEAGNFVLLGCPAEDNQALRAGLEEGLRSSKSIQAHSTAASNDSTRSDEDDAHWQLHAPLDTITAAPVQIDTIISIITLCSIPKQHVLPALTNLIALLTPCSESTALQAATQWPPGLFLMYEHTLNPHSRRTRLWQRILSPVWRQCLDGCELDRDTVGNIWEAGRIAAGKQGGYDGDVGTVWSIEESRVWHTESEDMENLFWHYVGKFVKKPM